MRRTSPNISPRQFASANAIALAKSAQRGLFRSKRVRGRTRPRGPFLPPEDWYEPTAETVPCYRVVTQEPGEGFVHVVTEDEVMSRLGELPNWMLERLEIVQLSSMTRKKQLFPCYGMQWGNSLYLYPIEESLVECYDRPPKTSVYNEACMFGGRWEQLGERQWRLHWTHESIRDFYLNNILIHELGHLLDQRNTAYLDRERFAEWFAIEHGYRTTQRARMARLATERLIRRRHHAK